MKTYCNPLSIPDVPSGRWLDTDLTRRDPRDFKDYRSISDEGPLSGFRPQKNHDPLTFMQRPWASSCGPAKMRSMPLMKVCFRGGSRQMTIPHRR